MWQGESPNGLLTLTAFTCGAESETFTEDLSLSGRGVSPLSRLETGRRVLRGEVPPLSGYLRAEPLVGVEGAETPQVRVRSTLNVTGGGFGWS